MTFVVLSSSAFVFLMYQQQQQGGGSHVINSTIEAQVLKSPRIVDMLSSNPLLSDSSSFQSHDNGLYYTYDGFITKGGGGGTDIFVTDYDDYVQQLDTPLGQLLLERAKDLSATILILGKHFQDADAATQHKGTYELRPT